MEDLIPTVNECPKCGCEQYYIRMRVSGVIHENHRFDGERASNEEMWDTVIMRPQKKLRCSDCNTIIPSK